jgi:uncharacterized membrane protein YdjX (TVP38/TMEM64 family)
MTTLQIRLLAVIALAIGAFFLFDIDQWLTLERFKAEYARLIGYRDAHPLLITLAYAGIYIAVTGLSLPGATVLTLAGGALFGLVWGTLIVSFASSIGATLAFLAARFLFRDTVKSRFGDRLAAIDAGLAKDGPYYLFTLRLVPLFPFFVINLLMGLTAIKTFTFYWVSQLGMLAGTVVYVNAGTQLAKIDSLSGILSPPLVGAFVLLGLFPLAAKKLVEVLPR